MTTDTVLEPLLDPKNTISDPNTGDDKTKMEIAARVFVETGNMRKAIRVAGYDTSARHLETHRIKDLEKSGRFRAEIENAAKMLLAETLTMARRGEVPASAVAAAEKTYTYFTGGFFNRRSGEKQVETIKQATKAQDW